MKKKIHLQYYALLREARGIAAEEISTSASSVQDLYQELQKKHGFRLTIDQVKVAINDEFKDWATPLKEGDSVVFIPPVSGG